MSGWELLIILVIVMLIFGTKRLTSLGGDLGSAIKSFRGAMEGRDVDSPAAAGNPLIEQAEAAAPVNEPAKPHTGHTPASSSENRQ